MPVVFKFRRGTAAEWEADNPILSAGEPGFEIDTGHLKIGDGLRDWLSLPYSSSSGGDPTGTIGDLSALTTTNKSSVVGAINEVNTPSVPLTSLYTNAKAG